MNYRYPSEEAITQYLRNAVIGTFDHAIKTGAWDEFDAIVRRFKEFKVHRIVSLDTLREMEEKRGADVR